jgi:putative ABC transport system permease protein
MVDMVAGGSQHSVTLLGVTEEYQNIRRLLILRGRYFDESDAEMRSRVCLLSEELAKLNFPSDDPVGKSIRTGEALYTVIGVFRERESTLGDSDIRDYTVLIPFTLLRYQTGSDAVRYLYAQADRFENVPFVTRQVGEVLKSRHRPEASYQVDNLISMLSLARHISLALMLILLSIGLITLTVGGVNIMNIMIVTVKERTREIGLRRAVGARRSDIRSQFLLEAVMMSNIGVIAAMFVAAIASISAHLFLPGTLPNSVVLTSVLIATITCCAIGIVFGYWPADKAARLDPSEALRFE